MNDQKLVNVNELDSDYRIRIDENEQKALFYKFFKKFRNVKEAASFLGISNSSFCKYYRCVVKYLPYRVVQKAVFYLNIDIPKILYKGNLKNIRSMYMKEAHPILAEKYGDNWAKQLTVRRDANKINLEDFPDDTYIFIEDEFRKKLLEAATNLFNSQRKLMKALNISPGIFTSWFSGKQKDYETNKIGLYFMPLKKVKEISRHLCEDNRFEFSMEEIEKCTLMYRQQAGIPIKKIILPLQESPQLVRLLFHLLGDGYGGKKGESASYKNICTELIEEVKDDLKFFGDVSVYEQENQIKFPRIIGDIIRNFYDVKLETFDSFISNRIKTLPKRLLYEGIRAYADDEATAYPSYIRFSSANYRLLSGIRELIVKYIGIKCNTVRSQYSVKARSNKMYYFDLRNIIKYGNKIGFAHPKKAKILTDAIRRKRKERIDYI